MTLVLVVDDVPALCEQYAYDLKRIGGFETAVATGGERALEMMSSEAVDCVVLDLEMPGKDGFEVLKSMDRLGIRVPVVVYTSTGSYERCVHAIKLGAYSFVDKAEPVERVVREIENAVEQHRLAFEVGTLKARLEVTTRLVGSSPAMNALHESIARLAPIPSPVLITGESGTGKELVARALHRQDRDKAPFVALNCAALPENLVESELFGHEKGAFTGANRLRKGAFEAAGNGTLLLDEVGELPPLVQAKLLRVLQEEEITRIGGVRTIPVGARVLAATNRNLEQEVELGKFREDLYYRLNVHVIHVPPLRERSKDIPALVDHFLRDICERFGQRPKTISPQAVEFLQAQRWEKNNVRELRNIVERMVIACDESEITVGHIPPERGSRAPSSRPLSLEKRGSLKDLKVSAEREIILNALERNDWHITNTAQELGLADHSSLLKVMRRHNLKKP